MANLSNVTSANSFGGGGTIPLNLNQYRRGNSFLGWNGGVASHENNSNIPAVGIGGSYTGNLELSDFNSPAHRDFLSGNYVSSVSTSSSPPEAAVGYASFAALGAVGCGSLSNIGTANRLTVGKSTYDWTILGYAETANIEGVFDFSATSTSVDQFAVVMTGDQRRTGWGGTNPANVGGTAGFAPTFIALGANTLSFANAVIPNGSYNNAINLTTWVWNNTMSIPLSGNYDYSISIFGNAVPPPPPPPPPPPGPPGPPGPGTVNITGQFISVITDPNLQPEAGVGYGLWSNGVASTFSTTAGDMPISGEWLVSGNASDYEVSWSLNSTNFVGTFSTPTANTWLPLSTSRIWSLTAFTANSEATRAIDVSIRHSNGTVLANALIQFQATYGIPN